MRSTRSWSQRAHCSGLLSELIVSLFVKCQGTARTVSYSFCELEVQGDGDEQLMWLLCKPSQREQAIGPIPVTKYNYPNFLAVDTKLSPFTYRFCVAEPLSDAQRQAGAVMMRNAARAAAEENLSRCEDAIAAALTNPEMNEEDKQVLQAKLDEVRESVSAQFAKAESLNIDELRSTYVPVMYDIDTTALTSQLLLKRDLAREALKDRATKVSGATDQPIRLADDEEAAADKKIVDTIMNIKWRMSELINLGVAVRRVLDTEPMVRSDQQGSVRVAYSAVPQIDIYRLWNLFWTAKDIIADRRTQISEQKFDSLLEDFDKKQRILRPTIAYAVSRMQPRTLDMLMTCMSDRAQKLAEQTKNITFVQSMPEHKYQRATASLMRHDDACKDISEEVVSVNADEERYKEAKAKREGDDS